jgi:cytochrome c biogenesis protein CcmG, thiol:disulfide interchange protein DsbE
MLKKLKPWLPFLCFILLSALCWQALTLTPHASATTLINQSLPPFQAQTLDNQRYVYHQPKQWLLIHAWSSWCPTCQKEHRFWLQLTPEQKQHLTIIGLNYKDNPNNATQWLRHHKNPYSIILSDPQGALAIHLGIIAPPETLLIDKYNKIRLIYQGPMNKAIWQQKVQPLLKAQS